MSTMIHSASAQSPSMRLLCVCMVLLFAGFHWVRPATAIPARSGRTAISQHQRGLYSRIRVIERAAVVAVDTDGPIARSAPRRSVRLRLQPATAPTTPARPDRPGGVSAPLRI